MSDVVNHIKMTGIIKDKVSSIGGIPQLIMLSGSHMYGFNSKDSDYDYRGFYIMQTGKVVGLDGIQEHVMFTEDENDVDITEVRKFLKLILTMNCNTLEHLFTPAIFETTLAIELREIVEQMLSKKGIYDSYKGMAVTNYKKFIFTGKKKTVKKYLYVFRALLAGIFALEHGIIEPNIQKLNKQYEVEIVDDLINDKITGLENDYATQKYSDGSTNIDMLVNAWIRAIDNAYIDSKLPPIPTHAQYDKLNKWLKEIRRANWK